MSVKSNMTWIQEVTNYLKLSPFRRVYIFKYFLLLLHVKSAVSGIEYNCILQQQQSNKGIHSIKSSIFYTFLWCSKSDEL